MNSYKDIWLGNMTAAQMRKFILWQNTYGGCGKMIWHSKDALAKFCDLPEDHPKYKTFSKAYDTTTNRYKATLNLLGLLKEETV